MPTTRLTGGKAEAIATDPLYGIRNLFLLMPHLPLTASAEIEYAKADPALLVQMADTAEATILMVHVSVSAIGQMLSRLTLFGSDDEVGADAVETLGWLLTELGDFAAVAFRIATACRAHTLDFAPDNIVITPNVRP